MELGEFDIEYLPRIAIKGQAFANFLVEFTNFPDIEKLPDNSWILYVDRFSTVERSGVGAVVITPKGEEFKYAVKLDFKKTNN